MPCGRAGAIRLLVTVQANDAMSVTVKRVMGLCILLSIGPAAVWFVTGNPERSGLTLGVVLGCLALIGLLVWLLE